MGRETFVLVVLVLLQLGCTSGPTTTMHLTSPKGTYSVDLKGPLADPRRFTDDHNVVASVATSGKTIGPFVVHTSGFFDSGFLSAFSRHEWPAENVLSFLAYAAKPRQSANTVITVVNQADRHVPCVLVSAGHLILIFDLPAGSKLAVPVPTRPADPSASIEVIEVGPSGEKVARAHNDFSRADEFGPVFYDVVITRDGLTLAARQ